MFAQSIMQDYETIPGNQGMKILRDVTNIETRNEPRDIVIRNITEPFWQSCINVVDKEGVRDRVAAVGSPGIGKTFATPILIRMLLKKNHTVVYLKRSVKIKGWYFEFVPSNPSIDVFVYPEKRRRGHKKSKV